MLKKTYIKDNVPKLIFLPIEKIFEENLDKKKIRKNLKFLLSKFLPLIFSPRRNIRLQFVSTILPDEKKTREIWTKNCCFFAIFFCPFSRFFFSVGKEDKELKGLKSLYSIFYYSCFPPTTELHSPCASKFDLTRD